MKNLAKATALIMGAIITLSCLNSGTGTQPATKPATPPSTAVSFPSHDPRFPPPSDVKSPFALRQDYPETYNANQSYPWDDIDFKEKPELYMRTVLNYSLEGNLEVDFKVQDNKVRNWYHAPWLHDDGRKAGNGREYWHGLTRERASEPLELHQNQTAQVENWAIGFYNEPGGHTLRKVWLTGGAPDPSQSTFPEGTVSFKLLFTTGTVEQVPFLAGTKEWTANVYPCNPRPEVPPCPDSKKRVDRTVRLLQIDIAVKDKDAGETGWVFGTFIYDASREGNNVWEKMAPVGLSWGDDSTVQSMMTTEGAFLNEDLKESHLFTDLIETKKKYTNEAYMRHHGLGGRLNGPVDNPISSCISCHARSGVTQVGEPMPQGNWNLTRPKFKIPDFEKYFSPIKGGANSVQVDSKTFITTDYSLQVATGIRNYYKSLQTSPSSVNKSGGAAANSAGVAPISRENTVDLPEITRGEK